MRIRSAVTVAVSTAALLSSVGCTSSTAESAEQDPAEMLDTAKEKLDITEGVELTLSTPMMADGVSGITAADGIVTKAPAFEGTISVVFGGTAVEVPVVGVNSLVYAQLPLTTGWSKIDPAEYGAPDPAGLMTGESGFSSLLPASTELEVGKSIRGGTDNSEVLTKLSGEVPGSAMAQVIPSSTGETFEADYLVTDESELREARFTGVFYPSSSEMTYVVEFEDYGVTQDIAAPDAAEG